MENRPPRPYSLTTVTDPPGRPSSFRVMLRPNPVPPFSRVRDWSTCRKSSQITFRSAGRIPTPVSATSTFTPPIAQVASTEMRPCVVNLTAFGNRFSKICLTFVRLVDGGAVRRDVEGEVELLFSNNWLHLLRHFNDHLAQEHLFDMQGHLSRFDSREVKDVVDQGKQVLCCGAASRERILLLRIHVAAKLFRSSASRRLGESRS